MDAAGRRIDDRCGPHSEPGCVTTVFRRYVAATWFVALVASGGTGCRREVCLCSSPDGACLFTGSDDCERCFPGSCGVVVDCGRACHCGDCSPPEVCLTGVGLFAFPGTDGWCKVPKGPDGGCVPDNLVCGANGQCCGNTCVASPSAPGLAYCRSPDGG